ncbi:hypothetical protein BJX70DRAFT_389160 [Aspergillus crustosus]
MSSNRSHALIFGASGISGWSLLNQCLQYPTPTAFRHAYLPDDPRLDLVSGINLTQPVSTVTEQLKINVHDIQNVNIVFFCAFIDHPNPDTRVSLNATILHTAIKSITTLSPLLSSVILQTGGMGSGLAFPNEVSITPPLQESTPRIAEPWASKIFFYAQYDLLKELSNGPCQKWTFAEIRPDGIIGFVPISNAMNLAHGIAFYLTLYRKKGYHSTHTDTSQDILAKMEIYAALNSDRYVSGEAYNIADGDVVSWSGVWPGLCEYFRLVGVEPSFIHGNKNAWDELVTESGLKQRIFEKQNWRFVEFMLVDFDFDREYDLSKAREVGFDERVDTVQGYWVAFDRMVRAGFIPSFE